MSKKTPQIRFKGFTDDWEERKLGEFTTSFSGGTPSAGNSSYYKGDIPFIRSGEINSDKTELFLTEDGLKNSSAKMVSVGDILYALYGATSGEVGISQINGAINQAILAISPSGGYSSHFIMQWLRLQKQKIIDKYLQGGQGNLSGSIVKNLILNVPNFEEQQQIGSFFKQLDDTITLHQRKLDLLKEQKKGFLQKMFPKNGSRVPELRFSGFADDWEERKLGDLATSFEYGLNASAKSFDGTHKYIRITDIDDSSRKFNSQSLTSPDIDLSSADNYKLKNGDILFARTGASVGKSYIYADSDGLVYYAGFLIRARIKSGVDSNFVFQHTLTSSYENFIRVTSQRSGQPGVNAKEYSTFEISVPSYEEQRKIGSFFKQLDDTITLHQRKLDLLKEQKKGFLQKMFVS
ncbi:restriction endonuclease subunit S [Leuconostoc mesenteroides]|uniref:restriction endonuclease subunit S n=1 Tax=Leuconostoc mesenteroides TaxID=1245 RepID=UPI00235E5428|nr:restriction endonuclease subunit S [Leuconostoc mesenteroides]